MISVLNRLLPLNGSKVFICLLTGLLLTSCFSTRKTVINDPKPRPTVAKVDTIVFTEIENPNVITEVEVEKVKPAYGRYEGLLSKKNYNILILAPFQNERFIRFYTGFKTAAEAYSGPLNMTVRVQNFENGSISPSSLDGVDLIVGPYRPNDIEAISRAISSRSIVMISPWLTAKNTQTGEHYVELGADMDMHFKALLKEANSRCQASEILIVARNDQRDQELVNHIKNDLAPSLGINSDIPTMYINDANDDNLLGKLQAEFSKNGTKCVLLPHWKDKIFLQTSIGRISAAKGGRDIVLYAMPQVLEIDDLDYSYLENLSAIVSTTRVPNFSEANEFDSRYFRTYGTSPDKEVYYGRDNFYLSKDILENLSNGQTNMNNLACRECLNSIDLLSISSSVSNDYSVPINLKNTSVNLLQFQNYKFNELR